jgi:hypothetical protein
MAETVKSTTIVQLPDMGGYISNSPQSTQALSDVLIKSWFPNTWEHAQFDRSVKLFPYKIQQIKNGQVVESFTLPISPQQLTVSTPFAVVVTPTLNGIVEEHNSVRFKDIEIAGTMGVFPTDRNPANPTFLDYVNLFDPTGVADTVSSVTAGIPLAQILLSRPELVNVSTAYKSGYANLHRLRIFLESYAEKKKTDKDLRLVFASYKDNQFYYVTPSSFTVRRSVNSPLEYEYSLALRSWASYNPNAEPFEFEPEIKDWNKWVGAALTLLGSDSLAKAAKSVAVSSVGLFRDLPTAGNTGLTFLGNFLPIAELRDFSRLTTTQIDKANQDISDASQAISESLGLTPQTNENVVPQVQTPSPDQMNVLFALNNVKINLDHAKAAMMQTAPQQVSPLDYVAGLASRSGIAFQTATSKYPAPFPANSTLEHFAARYLGDPNRWLEIATLNGLQAPYVDNVGVDLPLSFDGDKNKVVIEGAKLDIGRYVTVFSKTQPRKTYGVLSTVKNGNYYEITLDNDYNDKLKNTSTPDNLNRYKKADEATLHFYRPNTVHGGQILYIPSNEPSPINGFNSSAIPSLKQYEDEIRVSGVDLLLTEVDPTGNKAAGALDLVIQENDVVFSYGLNNIKQCLNLILFTPLGSLLQHPTFGLGTPVGTSNADINYQDFEQTIKTAILSDRTFSDVEFVTTSLNKAVLTVTVGVRVAQLNKVLPVAFDINLRGA